MKNILVPTDFSACASQATEFAFYLAKVYKAKLYIFTQLNLPDNWMSMNEEEQKQFPESVQRIHNAELLLKEWVEKGQEQGIAIKTAWSGGRLVNSIENFAVENKIDFIVMGSHGASGKNRYFIGSNTQKVVRRLHCPVLVIKDSPEHYRIEKVVFASNFDLSERKAFNYLLDLVKPFNPEIHLVAVNTSSWFGQPYVLVKAAMDDFAKLCGDLKCKTHFYRDWSIETGIRHLSEEINADLIVISNQERHPIKRIFAGSNVEALVNHAETPVLCIDFPKVEETVTV